MYVKFFQKLQLLVRPFQRQYLNCHRIFIVNFLAGHTWMVLLFFLTHGKNFQVKAFDHLNNFMKVILRLGIRSNKILDIIWLLLIVITCQKYWWSRWLLTTYKYLEDYVSTTKYFYNIIKQLNCQKTCKSKAWNCKKGGCNVDLCENNEFEN